MWKAIVSVLVLSGCTTLQQPNTLALCAAADVGTTLVGVSTGVFKEANPLWASSVNAGNPAAFILTTIAAVLLINWYDKPAVTGVASAVECGFAGWNSFLLLR